MDLILTLIFFSILALAGVAFEQGNFVATWLMLIVASLVMTKLASGGLK